MRSLGGRAPSEGDEFLATTGSIVDETSLPTSPCKSHSQACSMRETPIECQHAREGEQGSGSTQGEEGRRQRGHKGSSREVLQEECGVGGECRGDFAISRQHAGKRGLVCELDGCSQAIQVRREDGCPELVACLFRSASELSRNTTCSTQMHAVSRGYASMHGRSHIRMAL